jgi:hypothetical protein
LYAEKLNLSTYPECSEFCISKSKTILCKLCRFSWHIKCYTPKISQYYQNNKTNWACSGCKQAKPKSTQVSQNTQEPLIKSYYLERGGKFSLFDGNISGTFIKLIPNKRITMNWRNKRWPEGYYSLANMT